MLSCGAGQVTVSESQLCGPGSGLSLGKPSTLFLRPLLAGGREITTVVDGRTEGCGSVPAGHLALTLLYLHSPSSSLPGPWSTSRGPNATRGLGSLSQRGEHFKLLYL